MRLSEKLLQAMQWEGPAMVEYRYKPASGQYWLMEVNGRFWGSLPLAHHCGAQFAWESYRRAVLDDRAPPDPARHDLRARYMIPETKRLFMVLFARGRIGDPFFRARPIRDLWVYIAGFFDIRMRYFVFSPADPLPWLRDLRQMTMKALRLGKR
jgi:predicted ATP-grasp superfamily ATP-dependent carboligase